TARSLVSLMLRSVTWARLCRSTVPPETAWIWRYRYLALPSVIRVRPLRLSLDPAPVAWKTTDPIALSYRVAAGRASVVPLLAAKLAPSIEAAPGRLIVPPEMLTPE